MPGKIIKKNISTMYVEDMVRYLITVDITRALPEVRDSLKPVQRRGLYSMFANEHCVSLQTKKKSAKVVGDVMGNYHTHGDSSIYGALVNLANWYQTKTPLIEGYGNFGNVEGDGAAAMRYTEMYLSKFTIDNVIDMLKKSNNIVNWSPTFDDSDKEPDYLPVTVPLLLINGTFGIGVGIQTYIPPHNINEVVDATINLIKNPDADVVLIPDMCMNCHIIDTNWKHLCNTGHGKFTVRGNVEIGEYDGELALFVTSLPDGVTANRIKDTIDELVEKDVLPMITDVTVASKKNWLKMVIKLKKNSDANYVKDVLYKRTDIEKSFTVNFEVVDNIKPQRFSYKSYLQFFIETQKYLRFRYYYNLLQEVETEHHKKDAFIKVIKSGEIENIIKMIRKSKSSDEKILIEYLVNKVKLTDLQAKFILRTQLQGLSEGNLDKLIKDDKALIENINYYESIVTDDNKILEVIIDDLLAFKKEYGKPRICDVIKASTDLIPDGTFNIIITENNFIRKIGENEYANIVRGDKPKFAMKVRNTENILIFDTKGRVFKLPVHKIQLCDKQNAGSDLRLAIKGFTSDVVAMVYEPMLKECSKSLTKHYITVVTEGNYIKKMDLDDFLNIPLSGIVYCKLKPGDSVKDIEVLSDDVDIVVYTDHKASRMSVNDVGHYKRITQGDYAMKTDKEIKGVSVIYPNAEFIIVITKSGKINKFNIEGLVKSGRYKAGTNVIKLDKTDSIVTIYGVSNNDIIDIWTGEGLTSVNVSELTIGSSVSKGLKVISTRTGVIKTQVKVVG